MLLVAEMLLRETIDIPQLHHGNGVACHKVNLGGILMFRQDNDLLCRNP